MMYEKVARNFGDTTYTEQIEEKLAALEGKPPVPEQKAKYLVDLISEPEQKPLVAAGNNERKIFR